MLPPGIFDGVLGTDVGGGGSEGREDDGRCMDVGATCGEGGGGAFDEGGGGAGAVGGGLSAEDTLIDGAAVGGNGDTERA